MELADNIIVKNILNGNESDFTLLFTKYKRLVCSEALKYSRDCHEVDEISQEVFLRIYRSLALFNPEYRISTWIATITRNLCKTRAKGIKYYLESIEELCEVGEVPGHNVTPERIFIRQEDFSQWTWVNQALSSIPYRSIHLHNII